MDISTLPEASRLYRLTAKDGSVRLIAATTRAQAMRHAADTWFTLERPSPLTVAADLQRGIKMEAAGKLAQVDIEDPA